MPHRQSSGCLPSSRSVTYPPHECPPTTARSGIGDSARDEIREPRVDVLELGPADVADERVAPLAPVADRAAVVDHPDGEAGVDVCLRLRLPAVEVEPRRPAVDEHEHREGPARVVRRHEEAVHALPVRVLEVPRLVRTRRGGAFPERDDLRSGVVEDEPLPLPLLVEEPDPPVGADARLPDVARLGGDRLELCPRKVVAVEMRTSLVDVLQQERRAVGPPVVRGDLTLEVELEREARPFRGSRSRDACRPPSRGRRRGAGRRQGGTSSVP